MANRHNSSTHSNQRAESPVLRIEAAHIYLSCSRSFLYTLFSRGELKRIRLGGRAAGVLRADLDAWLQRQRDASNY